MGFVVSHEHRQPMQSIFGSFGLTFHGVMRQAPGISDAMRGIVPIKSRWLLRLKLRNAVTSVDTPAYDVGIDLC